MPEKHNGKVTVNSIQPITGTKRPKNRDKMKTKAPRLAGGMLHLYYYIFTL